MKTFIYTTKKVQQIHAQKVTCKIFRVINNTPSYIGEVMFSSGMTMGAESEVFNYLMDNAFIPKKLHALSATSWRSSGYYCHEVKERGVNIIGL